MSYQITSTKGAGTSVFFVGGETGALYVQTPNGRMVCVDANGSRQVVGSEYHRNHGTYSQVRVGQIIKIEVGK